MTKYCLMEYAFPTLEEFFEDIHSCPPAQLETQRCIVDGFPVFMKADFARVVNDLVNSGQYDPERSKTSWDVDLQRDIQRKHLRHLCGHTMVQATDFISPQNTTKMVVNPQTEAAIQLSDQQLRDYNMTLRIHATHLHSRDVLAQENVAPYDPTAVIATLEDITTYAKKKRIPMCFPQAVRQTEGGVDISTVMYHIPAAKRK